MSDAVIRGGRVTGVTTIDGRLFEADMVVNCAGRWANDPMSDAGLHLPLAPTVGFLVFTPPVAARVGRVVHSPIIQARPDGAGRLVLHWNATDATLAFNPRPGASMPEARDLVQRARRLLPWIGDVEPEAVRMAIRPMPGDSFSAVGPVPRVGRLLPRHHPQRSDDVAFPRRRSGRRGRAWAAAPRVGRLPPGPLLQLRLHHYAPL